LVPRFLVFGGKSEPGGELEQIGSLIVLSCGPIFRVFFYVSSANMRRLQSGVIVFLLGVSATAVVAEDGIWTPAPMFAQVERACIRQYRCVVPLSLRYNANQRVVSTPERTVYGICSAGDNLPLGSPKDACNVCLTNPPPDRCEWHVEKTNLLLR